MVKPASGFVVDIAFSAFKELKLNNLSFVFKKKKKKEGKVETLTV